MKARNQSIPDCAYLKAAIEASLGQLLAREKTSVSQASYPSSHG